MRGEPTPNPGGGLIIVTNFSQRPTLRGVVLQNFFILISPRARRPRFIAAQRSMPIGPKPAPRWEIFSHGAASFRMPRSNTRPRCGSARATRWRRSTLPIFSDGQIVPLTDLVEGQEASVLQLPAQPATAAEAKAQERVAHVG